MRRAAVLFLLLGLLFGCASQSQILINQDTEKTVRCSHYGWGLSGVAVSLMNQNNCIGDYKKMGFVEIEQIPAAGFSYVKKGKSILESLNDPAVIGIVHPNGPAYSAGLKSGDIIVEKNGQKINCIGDMISTRDKYKIGEVVTYTVIRDSTERKFSIRLVPISDILSKVK
jgi:S1-C subfamily serine protease